MLKTVLSLSVALVFTGCAFTPDQTLPTTQLPTAETKVTVQKDWWQYFNDPILNQLVDTALANNQNLALVTAKVDESRAKLGITSAEALPRIDLGGGGRRAEVSKNQTGKESQISSDYKLAAQASWEVDLWGRVRNSTAAAKQDLMAVQYNRDAVILTLTTEVVQSYFNLRALDAQLEITQNTVKSRIESNELQQKRFKGGVTSELDVKQSEVELGNAQSNIPDFQESIARQESALSVLLGQSPRTLMTENIERGKSISDLQVNMMIPAQLSSELLLQRPDIAQAEANLLAARARIQVARAAYFPRISLTGVLGVQSGNLDNLFSANSNIWSFAGDLAMPLFNSGLTAAQVDQAKAQEKQAVAQYQETIQKAFAETRASLIANQTIQKKIDYELVQVNALKVQLRLATLRYDNGYSSYLEVLDAQRSLFNTQLSLVAAQRNQLKAQVEFIKSIGGGWNKPAV
ncbi:MULTISPECIES: efflux transporter outer membrane subunit [Deefgea]|uniref:Efflux transporter outer membrane subunit n=1 Tax=Deefgea chitinilytica TaxID=570276 RepID=A0ABS2C9G2_9NEIS|nr:MULTISPECIES: efflux transporter outer membrane subunit [Deefgea]MBM5570797.1 efflux transporter outer membrane subunit [Deefgea chitinilytica]MBM9888026.1 efflux transporter outer membrane subunit [Deefgea sp. CFH1-16]